MENKEIDKFKEKELSLNELNFLIAEGTNEWFRIKEFIIEQNKLLIRLRSLEITWDKFWKLREELTGVIK